jgi:hypothetical protein
VDPFPAQPAQRRKPSAWWILATIVAGIGGATGAVAAGGHGIYTIPPFRAELRAWPATTGKTELAVRAPVIGRAHAEAATHQAPLDIRVTIIGVSPDAAASDLRALRDPQSLASLIAQQDGAAVRSFVIKMALLALGGGLGGGIIVSLGRWQRIVGGALAGLLAFAIVGVAVKVTYKPDQFAKTRFVLDHGTLDIIPSSLPTL